jgi:3-deoxy-7-phosphoheptulonate synthase
MLESTDDQSIAGYSPLISAAVLMEELPTTEVTSQTVAKARAQSKAIINGSDDRLMVVTGPCSIHDAKAALEYGSYLKSLAATYNDELLIVMRVYFEKPRTTVGWKGLINDPGLDNTFDVNKGLRIARGLLLDLADQGIPAGSEFLDVITPQFIADLISWGAIGARTTESQIHRELASGSSMPIGFKNGTDGNIQVAVDAIGAAKHPHHFLSITKHGLAAIVETTGNKNCHVILRGSSSGPNYDKESVAQAVHLLKSADLSSRIMIDASHGNSRKNHLAQSSVIDDVCAQVKDGSQDIFGVMIESHLEEGKQSHSNLNSLKYGQSITDACISLKQTEPLLAKLANSVLQKRKKVR